MSHPKYLVTARKYRPQLFSEVVSQEHVTETLKNAIRLDRSAHAYLFSGPRGVGKTTAARILAKAINCTTPSGERPDGAEPCRTCDSCRSFEEGRNLNIIEIDAASNNKVEDIRELRDTVRIPPQGNRKKVYIIDEVHMLSNAAFNALLKTLEEPPPYVLFIFATTEPHKVLPTILSRCQRFDFRRIAVPEIVAQLRHICEAEAVTADEGALMLIARKGDGALRDALSVFDQAVSLCGTDLCHDDLAHALGVVDIDLFFDATRHADERNGAGMIQLVERIVRAGYDLQEFVDGLEEHLRNLLVARTLPDTSLIEAVEATRKRYAEHCRRFSETDLLRLLTIVAEAEDALKSSRRPRLRLEMALLKMASMAHAADLRQALAQLDRLEKMAKEGNLPAVETPPSPKPPKAAAPEPPKAAAPEPPKAAAPEPPTSVVREPPPPRQTPPRDEPPLLYRADDLDEDDALPRPTPAKKHPAAPTANVPPTAPLLPGLFGPPALKKKPSGDGGSMQNRSAAPLDDGDVAVAVATASLLKAVEAVWTRFVDIARAERIHVGSLLTHGAPVAARDGALEIAVPDDFHQRLLGNQHDFLLGHLQACLDAPVRRLRFVIQDAAAPSAAEETPPAEDPAAVLQRMREADPVVRAIFEQFGGEISW